MEATSIARGEDASTCGVARGASADGTDEATVAAHAATISTPIRTRPALMSRLVGYVIGLGSSVPQKGGNVRDPEGAELAERANTQRAAEEQRAQGRRWPAYLRVSRRLCNLGVICQNEPAMSRTFRICVA